MIEYKICYEGTSPESRLELIIDVDIRLEGLNWRHAISLRNDGYLYVVTYWSSYK